MRAPDMPVGPPQELVAPMPALPRNLGPALGVPMAGPTSDALEERKYAYLDRDAERLLVFVADQVPDFSAGLAPKGPAEGPAVPK
jgi:hypothetical protein